MSTSSENRSTSPYTFDKLVPPLKMTVTSRLAGGVRRQRPGQASQQLGHPEVLLHEGRVDAEVPGGRAAQGKEVVEVLGQTR